MDKKVRVGMDISQLAHGGGVSIYTENLSLELNKISDLEMVYFYSSFRKPYKGKLKNIKKYKLPPTLFEIFFNRIRNVKIEKFLGPLDVFHSSDWTQPKSKAKKVTTYHDVIPLKYPHWSDPKIVSVQKRRLAIVEKEIDMVICVSNSTKKDLIEISNISEEKMVVIYEGVGEDFKPQPKEEIVKFKNKMGLPEKFILALSGIGQRKNLKRIKEATKGYNLVVSGLDLPDLPYHQLPLLYGSASLLLYPSLYEGFGLPILEAQSCGIPVVTSCVSSMPEVAGKGAILVDPSSTKDIVRGIEDAQQAKENLIKMGLENVKRFSWKKSAQETAKVYKQLVKS